MLIVANLGAMVVVNGSFIPPWLGIYECWAIGHDLQQRSRFRSQTEQDSLQTFTSHIIPNEATPYFVECGFSISNGLVDVDKVAEVEFSPKKKREVLKRKRALDVKLASFSSKSSRS